MARRKEKNLNFLSAGLGSFAGSAIFALIVLIVLYIMLKPILDRTNLLYHRINKELDILKKRYPMLFPDDKKELGEP